MFKKTVSIQYVQDIFVISSIAQKDLLKVGGVNNTSS